MASTMLTTSGWVIVLCLVCLTTSVIGQSTVIPTSSVPPSDEISITPLETDLPTFLPDEPSTRRGDTTMQNKPQDLTTLMPEISTSLPARTTVNKTTQPPIIIKESTEGQGTFKPTGIPTIDGSTTKQVIDLKVEFILVIIGTVVVLVMVLLVVTLIICCVITRRREKMSQHFVSFKSKSRGHRYEKVEREMAKGTLPRGADQPSGGWIFQASPGYDKEFDLPLTSMDTEADVEPGTKTLEINGNLDQRSNSEYPGSNSDYPGSDSALGFAAHLELEDEEEDLNPMYKTNSNQGDNQGEIPPDDAPRGDDAPDADDVGIGMDHADRTNTEMQSFAEEPERPVEL